MAWRGVSASPALESFDTAEEEPGLGHAPVEHVSVIVVELVALGAIRVTDAFGPRPTIVDGSTRSFEDSGCSQR